MVVECFTYCFLDIFNFFGGCIECAQAVISVQSDIPFNISGQLGQKAGADKFAILRPFKIKSFSSKHRRHFLDLALHGGSCLVISHLIVYFRLTFLSSHMCLESSVSLWYFLFFSDLLWFRYLVLKSLAVTPMYVRVSLLSVFVTSAL